MVSENDLGSTSAETVVDSPPHESIGFAQQLHFLRGTLRSGAAGFLDFFLLPAYIFTVLHEVSHQVEKRLCKMYVSRIEGNRAVLVVVDGQSYRAGINVQTFHCSPPRFYSLSIRSQG